MQDIRTTRAFSHPTRDDLIAGGIAGEIAGLIMAGVMMAVYALFLHHPAWYPVQVIGSFLFGDVAISGAFHPPSFVAGLLLHQLGPSLFWGCVFGLLTQGLDVRKAGPLLLTGLVVGLVSQVVDVYIFIQPLFNALHGHDIWAEQVPAFWSWAAHAVYGLSLATFGLVRPRLSQRPW